MVGREEEGTYDGQRIQGEVTVRERGEAEEC